jgi:ssDNA-binding Zn-finger/Zn-ribbon topoisomerase 1
MKTAISFVNCDLCGQAHEARRTGFIGMNTEVPEGWYTLWFHEEGKASGVSHSLDVCPRCYRSRIKDFADALMKSKFNFANAE